MAVIDVFLLPVVSDFWTRNFYSSTGRAMAQTVNRRRPNAETRVRSQDNPYAICGGQSGTRTGFSHSTSVNFIPPGIHYFEKDKNNNLHLQHRVAQEASRLRCVRSVCCGALNAKKTIRLNILSIFLQTGSLK
jgi:hypothetical protein